eukprot:ctg_1872.g701
MMAGRSCCEEETWMTSARHRVGDRPERADAAGIDGNAQQRRQGGTEWQCAPFAYSALLFSKTSSFTRKVGDACRVIPQRLGHARVYNADEAVEHVVMLQVHGGPEHCTGVYHRKRAEELHLPGAWGIAPSHMSSPLLASPSARIPQHQSREGRRSDVQRGRSAEHPPVPCVQGGEERYAEAAVDASQAGGVSPRLPDV